MTNHTKILFFYYTGCMIIKSNLRINSVHFLSKINWYIGERDDNKYLMLFSIDKSKEILKNMTNQGVKSKTLIGSRTNNSNGYDGK